MDAARKTILVSTLTIAFQSYNNNIAAISSSVAWPGVFFGNFGPLASLVFSIGIYIVGYAAGIAGAFLFGNYGDRIGRKRTMQFALVSTAIGAFGIAATPPYGSIGPSSEVLLLAFRVLEGMGISTMIGGGSWSVESAHSSSRRGLVGSSFAIGLSGGIMLAAFPSFFMITSLPHLLFETYGWRLLFVAGGLMMVASYIMVGSAQESRIFSEVKARVTMDRAPVSEAFRRYRKKILALALIQAASTGGVYEIASFTPGFINAFGFNPSYALLAFGVAAIAGVPVRIAAGSLADRFGRKSVVSAGMILTGAWSIPYLYLMLFDPSPLLIVADEIIFYCILSIQIGVVASLFSEQFPTRYRYSGTTLSANFGQFTGGLTSSVLGAYILFSLGGPEKSWLFIGAIMLVLNIISISLLLTLKETYKSDMSREGTENA